MIVQTEVSLYPLRTMNLHEPIEAFLDQLNSAPVEVHAGELSTIISGDLRETFETLAQSFARVAERYPVVLIVKVSNACPRRNHED